jgi:2-oxoglutarate ferredoxin oxidoreductase subunit beta
VVARCVGEAVDDLGIQENTIGVVGVGCHAMTGIAIEMDIINAAHGRAPGVATGIKRAFHGEAVVFTFQGDGDLGAIGLGDVLNAVNRGEKLTTIFFNNAGYGNTGGQMGPTTLEGQITTTSPYGRAPEQTGYPLHMAEMMASLRGCAYSARVSVNNLKNYAKARKAVKTAFQKQLEGVGYGFVEFLCTCPPGWKKKPDEALQWLEKAMMEEYRLGEFKNVDNIV